MVDQAAMDVFFAVEIKKRNPVPAILAETLLTLDFCQQKRKGRLRCSTHLLYVWIITHMYAGNHIHSSSDPLRSFYRIPVKQRDEHEWKVEFDNIDGRSFRWVCPWYENERRDIIYSCGKFPNIPLMGPRGCISYTPAIALKQLCWTQKEPQEEQLGGCCFRYKDGDYTKIWSKEIKDAWGNVRIAGRAELGRPILINTPGYVAWREARRAPNSAPKAVPRRKDHSLSASQMAEQLEVMEAQMQFLEQQKQAAELEVVIARSQCEKMAKDMEHLKDDQADANEALRARKGKEKVPETLLVKIRKLEEKVQILSKEKHEFKREISQRDKAKEGLKIEINKQKQVNEELEREIQWQGQAKRELEQKVEELTILLAHTEIDRDQGWASSDHYRDLLIETADVGRGWRNQALDWEAEIEEWKKKYAKVISELSHYIPNFVRRFEKADERVRLDPLLRLPREVDDFMEMCGGFARGLKRKKTRLLM